jgi:predicted peptidase
MAEDPAPGKQVEQKLDLGDGNSIEYLLYLPEDYDGTKRVPFMLFLHGRGESNGPLSLVKKWGPPRLIDRGDKMPYIVASPQCPATSFWSQAGEQNKLLKLLAHLEKTYPIDGGRMYLTGLSMGGFGSWTLAATHPDKFAAVAPICGKGNAADAEKLKDLPIWAWHGLNDRVVPPSGTEEIVEAIRKAGGTKVIYTSLEGIGHNAWSSAYGTPDLYSWFDRHRLAAEE